VLIPELGVHDFAQSLAVYRDPLGFELVYERPSQGFAICA
jgi:catechol 2,3-dioxygenase-like lactoylglutathione lyase family enzyme